MRGLIPPYDRNAEVGGTYFEYLKDYASLMVGELPRGGSVFCPFSDESTLHVRQLREAGFEVVCGGKTKARSGAEFADLLARGSSCDMVFGCLPHGSSAVRAFVAELIRFGKPFAVYMNFDRLLSNDFGYELIKSNRDYLTMVLPEGYTQTVCKYWDSGKVSKAYNQYFLTSGLFEGKFKFITKGGSTCRKSL